MTRGDDERRGRRAEEAAAIVEALINSQVDAVVGHGGVALLRLKEIEETLRRGYRELEAKLEERTAEARRRAEQLQALALQLTEAEERERRRLAVMLHDELQQQLVAVRLHVDILRARLPDESVAPILDKLHELAQDSIRASRSLSMELSPPMLYHEGLPTALRWLAKTMQEKHRLTVEVEAAADAGPRDERLAVFLFQAARELLFNITKHAGVEQAWLRLGRLDGDVVMEVEDRGCGFEHRALHDSVEPVTGLGLLSVRERAELLGAAFEIDSAPGRGARVSLRWREPSGVAEAPPAESAAPHPSASVAAEREADAADGLRVLLVDDHAVVRHGLRLLLEQEADVIVIGEAEDGAAGVEAARRLRPDVVVMDVAMPVLDGVEATRRITAARPGVRVIGLSVFDNADTEQRMREAGAEHYLAKSGPSEALLAAVRGTAGGARTGD